MRVGERGTQDQLSTEQKTTLFSSRFPPFFLLAFAAHFFLAVIDLPTPPTVFVSLAQPMRWLYPGLCVVRMKVKVRGGGVGREEGMITSCVCRESSDANVASWSVASSFLFSLVIHKCLR